MKTILVIEDNNTMRQKVVTILKMEGYEPLVAPNGLEGIRVAKDELPDLILCDIMMPECDGYEVLQALRIFKPTANIPFIFLTAKGEKAELRAGMNLGADDYLVKPVPRVELLEAIDARLERRRLQEQRLQDEIASLRFEPDFTSHEPLSQTLSLTSREAETLLWVAQGKSNGEIATIFGTAEKTVKKCMGNIFDKLGVSNRTAATVRALEVLNKAKPCSEAGSPS
jgi:DNA-binding NarL/FixJ family response regulator